MSTMLAAMLDQACSSRFAASLIRSHRRSTISRALSSSPSRQEEKRARPQTQAADNIELSAPAAYISESHDPWFNLSYEDWLLRNTRHDQPVLFIYRNFPCVVIGRNQNPWKETTPRRLREWAIPMVRRRSGGGTVFHDMGNTNFSIILPRLLFTRAHGAELVARAVRDHLGISQCTVNERNDVIIKDGDRQLKHYVSGSAYKIIQHRAYHHGTMLISSSLSELGKALKSASPNIETKGIPSFRSPVTTLNHYLPTGRSPLKHEDFVRAVTSEFAKVYADGNEGKTKTMQTMKVTEASVKDVKKVWEGVAEMKSWEWEYGSSPEFSHLIEGVLSLGSISASMTARHGLITSFTFHLDRTPTPPSSPDSTQHKQDFLDALALSFIGKRYETLEGAESGLSGEYDTPQWRESALEVLQWLRSSM